MFCYHTDFFFFVCHRFIHNNTVIAVHTITADNNNVFVSIRRNRTARSRRTGRPPCTRTRTTKCTGPWRMGRRRTGRRTGRHTVRRKVPRTVRRTVLCRPARTGRRPAARTNRVCFGPRRRRAWRRIWLLRRRRRSTRSWRTERETPGN